jgi:hypothetical protein
MKNSLILALNTYKKAAALAVAALIKNWVIIPGSCLAYVFFMIIQSFGSKLGMAGGIIVGFIFVGLVSLYYTWITRCTNRDTIHYKELATFDPMMFNRVMGVSFIIWLGSFALTSTVGVGNPTLVSLILLGVNFVLNAMPEVLHQQGYERQEAFQSAFEFFKENWWEWFLPIALLTLGPVLATLLISGIGSYSILTLAMFVSSEFIMLISAELLIPFAVPFVIVSQVTPLLLAMAGIPSTFTVAPAILLSLVLAHWYMLFRAFLFRELSTSTRRQRAFKARTQDKITILH